MSGRLRERFVRLLRQGLSPQKLALSVAVGFTLSLFPALGLTTLLCLLIGPLLGLNQPALQIVNYLVYPVQIALLIPFYRFGEWLFHAPPFPITASGVQALLNSGITNAIHVLWDTTMHAIVAWGLVSPLLIGGIYLALVPAFLKLKLQSAL